ncbi:DUF4956 domain-containing protein [Slackia exigua]
MQDLVFSSILGTAESTAASATAASFLACCATSIILGLACALIYRYKTSYSKSFVVTLALLPLIVQMVIMLVNGNLGVGVAVMGVFNLVRFRSIPGTAKEIGSVFLAMAVGLATGMGFIGLAVLFAVIVGIVNIVYVRFGFGAMPASCKTLTINVPEDLEFDGVFDEPIERYASSFELSSIQTTNMGSLFQLRYDITLRERGLEKKLIDELRCLNGNLKITLGAAATQREAL